MALKRKEVAALAANLAQHAALVRAEAESLGDMHLHANLTTVSVKRLEGLLNTANDVVRHLTEAMGEDEVHFE